MLTIKEESWPPSQVMSAPVFCEIFLQNVLEDLEWHPDEDTLCLARRRVLSVTGLET